MVRKKVLAALVIPSLMLPAIPSFAQLEEVLVTARKREESVLNVPVAVTAFNAEQLAQFGTDDLYTLTERVPGFVMGTQVASIGPTPSLRGIGTGTLNASIDQSVSLNIDGMGFSQALAYSTGMFDMASLEVLRGPQSLFYGKNSTAGVISITTKDPGDEFEAEFSTGYETEAEEWVGSVILSGPVTDTLGLRFGAKFSDMEGYFKNEGVGDGVSSFDPKYPQTPDREDLILRGTILWEPTETFTAKLKGNYNKVDIDGNGGAGQITSCPDGTATNFPDDFFLADTLGFFYGTTNPQFLAPDEDCKLDDVLAVVDVNPENPLYTGIRNNGVPFYDMEQYFGTLLLDWQVGNHTLSSVTGYYDLEHNVMINGGQTGGAGPLIIADTNFWREEFTQEFRVTSNHDGAWNYMFGAYYQDAEMTNRTGLFFLGPRDKGKLPIDIETWAVFGQVLWNITPSLELAVGARYTDEERQFKPINLTTGEPFPQEDYGRDELQADDVTPDISLTWSATDSVSFYVGYREAFKSGSWDSVSNPRAGEGLDLAFDEEKVKGYEGGMKSYLADNTVALNVSGYYYEYDDLQVGSNQSTSTGFTIITLNAASAEVYGIDFDVTWAPEAVSGLELFAVANYNHAEYDKFDEAPCWGGQTFAEGCNLGFDPTFGLYSAQDLSGGELLRAPEYQATFGFSYDMDISESMVMTIGSSTQWSDEYANNTLLREDFFQDSFFKTSANISVREANGKWEVSLIGKNLNDEVTAGNCSNFNGVYANTPGTVITGSPDNIRGIAGVDELTCIAERGREIWLNLTLRI